ncbi:DUF4221 family protein [Chitinophaga sp. YIM B06452]|uniref:DUF4221 family protein n=1 Tax=Chitinophaga sp. YIM B06452 TaxID=3082158 RepID=UPI0031FED59F
MKAFIPSIFIMLFIIACKHGNPEPQLYYPQPAYHSYNIIATQDTINFLADEESFSDLESWSVRQFNGKTYIAFFEQMSASIILYDYPSNHQADRIDLQRFFKPNSVNSAYFHNYDSIFVTTRDAFYMLDSAGKHIRKVPFISEENQGKGRISTENSLYLKNDTVFISVTPATRNGSKSALRSWKLLWSVDLKTDKVTRYYHLPDTYTDHYYVGKLNKHSYCMNKEGRFVVSFATDTLLYETDLKDYHHAYFAKSQYQIKPVKDSKKEDVNDVKEEGRIYMISDSYGSIFYDPYHERYLRVAKPAISEADFNAKKYARPYRLIIFDKNFQIIGESDFENGIELHRMFATPDGKLYAQVMSPVENQYSFRRLEYQENHISIK